LLERNARIEHSSHTRRITVGADKGYDAKEFVEQCRQYAITPQIARNARRTSAIDERHVILSQRIRKRIEEIFRLGGDRRRISENAFKGHWPERNSRRISSERRTTWSGWHDCSLHRHRRTSGESQLALTAEKAEPARSRKLAIHSRSSTACGPLGGRNSTGR